MRTRRRTSLLDRKIIASIRTLERGGLNKTLVRKIISDIFGLNTPKTSPRISPRTPPPVPRKRR